MQWHPFTISSAPEEKTVTVHIRESSEGSWTKELCAYICAMGPRGKPFFALDRRGPQGKLQGKILRPDGKPMLCIDGPHSGERRVQHVTGREWPKLSADLLLLHHSLSLVLSS